MTGAGPAAAAGALTHWEGEPVRIWEEVWGVAGLEVWDRVGSTNDRARERARGGAPAFTVIIAEEQTAGRGRSGRSWSSPPGLGLWMSVILPDAVPDARVLVPLLVGVAVCRAVEVRVPGVVPRLKWPNDVLLGERKVAGVLCESESSGPVVAGTGINVRHRPADFPPELRARAASLEMAAGAPVSRGALAGALVRELRTLLDRPPLRLDGDLGREVARRDALHGARVRTGDGRPGVARGIDPTGALRVERAGGAVEPVRAGSVTVDP